MDFGQLSLLLVVAAIFGMIARFVRQPLLVGFLFAGVVLGVLNVGVHVESLEALGKIGVTLLLFLLGLEMRVSDLSSVGKVSLATGLGQILFTATVGYGIATFLGFGPLQAAYIAVALTFSSTIIIVKLLSEKQDLSSLYGKISVGFLLVQDFVAIAILIFLSGLRGDAGVGDYIFLIAKAVGLFAIVALMSKRILPTVFERWAAPSSELLFIVSVGWALGLASFVSGPLGFSPEIGGFLAGIALSSLPEHLQIASRAKPLRDFFLTIFFLLLGTKLVVSGNLGEILPPAIIFSAFVFLGNPLIVFTILSLLGYKSRTSFLSGLTVAQISEFSFVLMAMGLSLGHLTETNVSMIVIVGVITMTMSTYVILEGEKVYSRLKPFLKKFERKNTRERFSNVKEEFDLENHIILIGCDRTGKTVSEYLKRKNKGFVVIDYNPEIVTSLRNKEIPTLFGDISDVETLTAAAIEKAKAIISTAPQLEDNLTLLEYLAKDLEHIPTIVVSSSSADAKKLYAAGATYVVIPEAVSGEHIRHMIAHHDLDKKKLKTQGEFSKKRLAKK